MEAIKGDWCDLCLEEIVDTKNTYGDHIFSICAKCIALESDRTKMVEKTNDS